MSISKVRNAKRPVAVVVQTHWDREWYFPHQTFVARLLQVMARVVEQLEQGELQQFLFDGQTAAFEDLIANAEPSLVQRVQALVREKRIVLGPWYVMADEFLVCGESLLRNLEIGIADANAAGNCQYVGYLPDTFGHIGQMPQLLANFGIQSAVMWRGVDSPVAEFDWQSPDGTTIGAVYLTQGYYQHPLNVADWAAALDKYLDSIATRSLADELLLTQGGDHLLPTGALQRRIAEFNTDDHEYRLKESSLAAHVAAALAGSDGRRATIRGALRNNKQAFVLPDVLSTRRYLKRLNQNAEDRLVGLVEPLLVQLGGTAIDPHKYLLDTWRMLVQQQAHDSICGCSIDGVHQEMLTRYRLIDQRLEALIDQIASAAGLQQAAAHDGDDPANGVFADDSRFTLFNPLPKRFAGSQIVTLFLRGEPSRGLSLETAAGECLESELLSVEPASVFRSPVDDFPERLDGYRYEMLVRCEIGGLGALACVVERVSSPSVQPAHPDEADRVATGIENADCRVDLSSDGKLTIQSKRTGALSMVSLLSELDAGDSYNFSPPANQNKVVQETFKLVAVKLTQHMQELRVSVEMRLPAGLSDDRRGRSSASVVNVGALTIRLFADSRVIDCTLDWTNAARDQRTRLLMSLLQPVGSSASDCGFEWTRTQVTYADYPTTVTRQEMRVVVNPSLSAIEAGSLLFLHRAMQEYEILHGLQEAGGQQLGVTLIRSVGWLSRRDLVTRGVGAGPDMATPDAQCLGTERFEFQIAIDQHNRDTSAEAGPEATAQATVHPLVLAERFRRPLMVLRGHTERWGAEIEIDNANLQVSAIRRVGDAIELRLWNPTDAVQSLSISSGVWMRVNADGSPSDRSACRVEAHEIVTLRCRP